MIIVRRLLNYLGTKVAVVLGTTWLSLSPVKRLLSLTRWQPLIGNRGMPFIYYFRINSLLFYYCLASYNLPLREKLFFSIYQLSGSSGIRRVLNLVVWRTTYYL